MEELNVETSDHKLDKPLRKFTLDELAIQLDVYEAQLYNTQVELMGDSRGIITQMIAQLGKGVKGLGIQHASTLFWLSEKVHFRVMTIVSKENIAESLKTLNFRFESFGNISDGYYYTVRGHQKLLSSLADKLTTEGVTVYYKSDNGNAFMNILDVRAMQMLAENMTLTSKTLELCNSWIEVFASVNTTIYQMDLGIKQIRELMREKSAEQDAQAMLESEGYKDLDSVVEKVKSTEEKVDEEVV